MRRDRENKRFPLKDNALCLQVSVPMCVQVSNFVRTFVVVVVISGNGPWLCCRMSNVCQFVVVCRCCVVIVVVVVCRRSSSFVAVVVAVAVAVAVVVAVVVVVASVVAVVVASRRVVGGGCLLAAFDRPSKGVHKTHRGRSSPQLPGTLAGTLGAKRCVHCQ
mgnify:CR=1 FL=1